MKWNFSFVLLISFNLLVAQMLNTIILTDKENVAGNLSASAALKYIDRLSESKINNIITFLDSSSWNGNDLYYNMSQVYKELVKTITIPPLVIDLTNRDDISSGLKLFLEMYKVPAISVFPPETTSTVTTSNWLEDNVFKDNFIQLLHPFNNLLKVVRIIIETKRIPNVAILFSKSFERIIRKDFLQDIHVRQIYVNMDYVVSWRTLLVELQDMDIFNYFILGHYKSINSIVKFWAECSPYLSRKIKIFIITQDYINLKRSCKNIYLIKPELSVQNEASYVHYLMIDENYFDVEAIFYFDLVVKSVLAFRSQLTLAYDLNLQVVDEFYNSSLSHPTNMSGFSFLSAFIQTSEDLPLTPFLVYKNGRGQMDFTMKIENYDAEETGKVVTVGIWQPESAPSDFYFNLSTRPIYKIVTVTLEPFTYKSVDENGTEHYAGYCIDLIEEISHQIGFDYQIYTAPANIFGTLDENGSWNGLIQELISKRADIGIACTSWSAEREIVVDFTVPIFEMVGMSILMKKFDQNSNQFMFITAMEESVWIWSIVIYFTASLLLWMFSRVSPNEGLKSISNQSVKTDLESLSMMSCLWFCISSHSFETNKRFPNSISGFLTLGTWWMFGTVLLTSYTANLAAFLTVARMDTQIQSLDDLASQSGVQYAVIANSSNSLYFQRMAAIEERFHKIWIDLMINNGLSAKDRGKFGLRHYPVSDKYSKLWNAMQTSGLLTTIKEATERVLASKSTTQGFAYLGDSSLTQYLCLTSCEFTQIHTGTGKLPFSIALQKDSPLKDLFNKAISQLHRNKLLAKLKTKWYEENPYRKICDSDGSVNDDSIYLSDIGAVYVLIVFGLFLTCFVLILEKDGLIKKKSSGNNQIRKKIIEDIKPYNAVDIPFTN